MKRFFLTLICLFGGYYSLVAQSVIEVLRDANFTKYVWAKGYGATIEDADRDAMNTLAKTETQVLASGEIKIKNRSAGQSVKSEVDYDGKSSTLSSVYLSNVKREVLADVDGKKCVLRYISVGDWDKRHEVLKGKIEEYIESGKYATLVEDKIRYYAWANILLELYPTTNESIKANGQNARQWLPVELRNILNKIKISVIGIEVDKANKNYPHKLYLDFIYDGEPISYLQFAYFDGRGWSNESIKDGRSVVQVANLEPTINLELDCLSADLARQLEPTVGRLIEAKGLSQSYIPEGLKSVKTKTEEVKPQKKLDTSTSGVKSEVAVKLEEVKNTHIEVKDKVDSTRPFVKILNEIASAISNLSTQSIRHHFTDEAWNQYELIVANGKPIIARTPEYQFIAHDSLTICHSLPLKLTFSGNRSFVEDVIFRINNNTLKVESVAYKLSAKTEQAIMAMAWDDKARLTLISFLEDYRSAYCLRDINYIEKVFAEDAYIVVGRVWKPSDKKFSDKVSALGGTLTEYTAKTKAQYVSDLNKSFKSKEFINLRFEECNVAKGYYAKEGIYAVQVKQLYYSNNYADNGILTLAIDMRKEANPLVRVRIWQEARDVTYNAEQMIERTVSVEGGLN